MKTFCRLAATFGALAAQGIRVGEDEVSFMNENPGGLGGKDDEKSKKLQDWFNNNTLPSGDQEKMDGSVDDPIWAYMKSECFQGRYRTAVKYMLQKNCKTAIEVGGYLTPLDKYILEQKKEEGKGKGKGQNFPTKYINIDPSMKGPKAEKNDGLETYHLPMTLADFFSSATESLRKEFGFKADSDDTCVLIFGIWDPHYKTDEDKAAMAKLFKNSLWVGVETSEYAKNWLETTGKVCEKAGLKLAKDEDADCREALKGQKPDTSILRHMKFFERKSGDSLSTASESSEDEEEDEEQAKKSKKKASKHH